MLISFAVFELSRKSGGGRAEYAPSTPAGRVKFVWFKAHDGPLIRNFLQMAASGHVWSHFNISRQPFWRISCLSDFSFFFHRGKKRYLTIMWWEPVFVMAGFLTPASDGFFLGTSDSDTDSDRPLVQRRRDTASPRSVGGAVPFWLGAAVGPWERSADYWAAGMIGVFWEGEALRQWMEQFNHVTKYIWIDSITSKEWLK